MTASDFVLILRGCHAHALMLLLFAFLVEHASAQAPVNDIVSWPSGMLLLATVLYAGLGNSLDQLWAIEPAAGLFLFNGLPVVNMWGMNKAFWNYKAIHFVSKVRPAVGRQACWVPSENVTSAARQSALQRAMKVLSCVTYVARSGVSPAWELRATGLLFPVTDVPVTRTLPVPDRQPSSRDFLLFAAIGYHVEWEKHTTVYSSRRHNYPLFSTRGSPWAAIFDVDSVEMAEVVVAANMARRQFHESRLRALATLSGDVLLLDFDAIGNNPVCTIDFHSYAPAKSKVSAPLRDLAESYYVVVQYIKKTWPTAPPGRPLAQVFCNGSLWTAILGGEFLAHGRLTVQRLPTQYMSYNALKPQHHADEMYCDVVDGILEQLEAADLGGEAHAAELSGVLGNGGISRSSAGAFLAAGLLCQAIVCYFLSVGTSAGVWTSVAMANALFAGRLPDLHSVWCSRRTEGEDLQPGLKMRAPDAAGADPMAVATLDRSAPAQGALRPGFLLNAASIAAAILGSVFQRQTRRALGFSAFQPAQVWVLYAAVGICVAVSLLLLQIALRHWIVENSWKKMQDLPDRVIVLSTVPASLFVSALALYFHRVGLGTMWPILDAVTFLSGLPLGMIENGGMVSVDENMFHLVLLNRWVMGAVGSSLGRGLAANVTDASS